MNVFIILIIIILGPIISSIWISKSEDKKDKLSAERKKENIYNDYFELSKVRDYKAEYKEYLQTDHWKEIRLKALNRAGNRCQLCCNTYNLNVHHNTYRNKGHEDLKDLVVLCRECHAKFHDKMP